MVAPALFSSATDEWATPQALFDELNQEFGFVVDVCATRHNAKVSNYMTPERNGLLWDWGLGPIWMNPPYSPPEKKCKGKCTKKRCAKRGWHRPEYKPGCIDWVRKACLAAQNGGVVVCLLPARTDTKWWHDYVQPEAAEIRFLKGRLRFGGAKNSAPFPSAVVVFRPPASERHE